MANSKTNILPGAGKPYKTGKNYFTINSNGIKREYYVHVPKSYTGINPFPLVFMLHGHGGDGEEFYNRSGWKEVGETKNILTVFPSSYHYNIIDDGVIEKNAKVWNKYGTIFCAGETPCDDVYFLSQVIDDMEQKYNVADKQVFIVGFSNGACMAARCAIELSNRIAGAVCASGSLPDSSLFTPQRLLPVLYQMGNEDAHQMEKLQITVPFPMNFAQLYSQYPPIQSRTDAYIQSFGLQPAYTVSGDPNSILSASYRGLSGRAENIFNFWIIKGLGHAYPNGKNHKLMGAQEHWQWLRKYKLP